MHSIEDENYDFGRYVATAELFCLKSFDGPGYRGWNVHVGKSSSRLPRSQYVVNTEILVTRTVFCCSYEQMETFTNERVASLKLGIRDSPINRAHMKRP